MKPTIGRIVHYTNLGDKDGKFPPEIQAAIVTGVYTEGGADSSGHSANKVGDKGGATHCDLLVFYRTGFFQCQRVPFSEAPERGHWNWPPRE